MSIPEKTRGAFAPGPPRPDEVIDQRGKHPCHPETDIEVPDDRRAPVAEGGAEVHGVAAPGVAAQDALRAIGTLNGFRSITRCIIITVAIAILHPLPDIAMHMRQAKLVGRERGVVHRYRLLAVDTFRTRSIGVVAVVVRLRCRDRRASPEWCRRTGAGRVLPLRLRRQTVGLARLVAQPFHEVPGIVPAIH